MVGTVWLVLPPLPSWPDELWPQDFTVLSVRARANESADEVPPPDIWSTSPRKRLVTEDGLRLSARVPLPSWPVRPAPQLSTVGLPSLAWAAGARAGTAVRVAAVRAAAANRRARGVVREGPRRERDMALLSFDGDIREGCVRPVASAGARRRARAGRGSCEHVVPGPWAWGAHGRVRRPGRAAGHISRLSENDHRGEPESPKHPFAGPPFGAPSRGRIRPSGSPGASRVRRSAAGRRTAAAGGVRNPAAHGRRPSRLRAGFHAHGCTEARRGPPREASAGAGPGGSECAPPKW